MTEHKYSLVLGSQSPRRKELLGHLEIPFEVVVSNTAETSDCSWPGELAMDVAAQKGDAVWKICEKRSGFGKNYFPLVVCADTIVVLGEKILGKPRDRKDARDILLQLSGKTHSVVTGVYLAGVDLKDGHFKRELFYCQSQVEFEVITPDLLDLYLVGGESLDKAGAYGIQGQALLFIKNVGGSYSNVVGFPLAEVVAALKKFIGFSTKHAHGWNNFFHYSH